MNIKEISNNYSNLLSVALVYARVFAGWPWFEVSACPACGKFFPTPVGEICSCDTKTIRLPAYPDTETESYIRAEISKPMAQAFLGFSDFDTTLVGFGWGFAITSEGFAQSKYKTEKGREIISRLTPDLDYFYVSEVGVDPSSQTRGLGTEITRLLSEKDQPRLLRTLNTSPMAKIAVKLGYSAIIGPEKVQQDPENPDRLIFIKE